MGGKRWHGAAPSYGECQGSQSSLARPIPWPLGVACVSHAPLKPCWSMPSPRHPPLARMSVINRVVRRSRMGGVPCLP